MMDTGELVARLEAAADAIDDMAQANVPTATLMRTAAARLRSDAAS